jgi:hypothetical protein
VCLSAERAPKIAPFSPMSTRVYAWQEDPNSDPTRFLYRCSNSSAEAVVDCGRGQFLDVVIDGHETRVLWLFEDTELAQERAARNQLLVLARRSNKGQGVILHPPRSHYSIPHAGDRVPMRDRPGCPQGGLGSLLPPRKKIAVSSRSVFNVQQL